MSINGATVAVQGSVVMRIVVAQANIRSLNAFLQMIRVISIGNTVAVSRPRECVVLPNKWSGGQKPVFVKIAKIGDSYRRTS
jgi:hypothetical protein